MLGSNYESLISRVQLETEGKFNSRVLHLLINMLHLLLIDKICQKWRLESF